MKYLHQKALEFDIGIYFEANGHGTVLFSQKAIEVFQEASTSDRLSSECREAAQQLLALTVLINQAVGDAISDLLLVEAILINKSVRDIEQLSLETSLIILDACISGWSVCANRIKPCDHCSLTLICYMIIELEWCS